LAKLLTVTLEIILRDFLVQYFALVGPRVPGARIAECPNSGQKSQECARLKKYRSWLGLKTRNQGCYWCAKLSANLGDPLLVDQHPIQQPESFHRRCRAATDYEVKLHGEFSFKIDLPVG
jgi:hypothetical protein